MIEELYIIMNFLILNFSDQRDANIQVYKCKVFIGLTENGGNGGKFEFVKVSMQICSSF